MELKVALRSQGHEEYVLANTNMFVSTVHLDFWRKSTEALAELEGFAASARAQLSEASKEMENFIKTKFNNDEDMLTKHAARMRTAGANVVLLQQGVVPALKIDGENPKLRMLALQAYGYLRAEIEATKYLII